MDAKKSQSLTTINDVNDYCLMHIFQYLPFPDRTRIERVNKHWQEVSLASWCMYSRRLNVGSDTASFPADDRYQLDADQELIGIMRKMLHHRGRYLKQIFFSPSCWDKLRAGTLKAIAPLCQQIVRLQAENLQVSPDDMLAIIQYCHNLESLGLGWGSNYTDDQLRLVFTNNPRMRSLRIVNCPNFTGSCLAELQDNVLEKLEVQYCANFRLTEAAAARFSKSLIEFSLYSDFPSDHGVHCVMMLNSLKRVTLSLHAEELRNMDDGVIRHVRDIRTNMHLTSSCPVWIVKFHR